MDNADRHALFGPNSSRQTEPADSRQPQQQQPLQQQQQQLSWEQVRRNIDVGERQRGLRSAYESVEVGREALERLDDQKGQWSESRGCAAPLPAAFCLRHMIEYLQPHQVVVCVRRGRYNTTNGSLFQLIKLENVFPFY